MLGNLGAPSSSPTSLMMCRDDGVKVSLARPGFQKDPFLPSPTTVQGSSLLIKHVRPDYPSSPGSFPKPLQGTDIDIAKEGPFCGEDWCLSETHTRLSGTIPRDVHCDAVVRWNDGSLLRSTARSQLSRQTSRPEKMPRPGMLFPPSTVGRDSVWWDPRAFCRTLPACPTLRRPGRRAICRACRSR
ncbi:hypothetical protein N658DRAFT_67496 [Parathielavia hyrcaniae]|uniref:Uncharacterized protein n=1 Tax=Parathielavia hyrcaniae TaxID=113614 RepID=A0AAN6Q081_9PEZI|nr:hypothetical protein N658DRAFT_67496 [Parathielavia hyrcaniae]